MEDRTGRLAELLRFERTLSWVRWFGIALGAFEVLSYQPQQTSTAPSSTIPMGLAALGVLLIVNVAALLLGARIRTEAAATRLGYGVFAGDMAALWTITWAYNFEPFGNTWIILSIACLEGAHRAQLRGALTPVAIALPVETGREMFTHIAFGYTFSAQNLAFRLGFLLMVGTVAGILARNLGRERAHAVQRAVQLADLAAREAAARRESAAFQDVILAGVSSPDLENALQAMIERISAALGYERIAVLLLDDREHLRPVAGYGFPDGFRGESVPVGQGISGSVAETGRSEIVGDVRSDLRYYQVDATTRSQVTVPIAARGVMLGVLDVESPELDAFDDADQWRLERLSAQIALVIEQSRLIAIEREGLERLRQLDAMKSDFVAIASHELRTPLTAMKGSIKTLRRHDTRLSSEDTRTLLAMLDRQSERLTRLVDDLLIASNLDAGGLSLRLVPTNITHVIDGVLEELGARAGRVSVAVPQNLPSVLTDGQRVGQIARNLIENALKFAPEETLVRVTIHHEPGALLIEVTDEGPGIADEDRESVFDRFHQVGDSLRRQSEGFGLGLYITKRLVEALGGNIEIDSQVARGSTFRVWLPDATDRGSSAALA